MHDDRSQVVAWVKDIIQTDNVHCWAASQVVHASEPLWIAGDG